MGCESVVMRTERGSTTVRSEYAVGAHLGACRNDSSMDSPGLPPFILSYHSLLTTLSPNHL